MKIVWESSGNQDKWLLRWLHVGVEGIYRHDRRDFFNSLSRCFLI